MNYISIISILFVIFYFFNNINVVEGLKLRIIGGRSTKSREIKYLVAIRISGHYTCGGGIIGEKYILTAAHCVIHTPTNELKRGRIKIVAGSDNLKVKTPSTVKIRVKKIYVPIYYNGTLWDVRYPEGDIAVLELKENLNLTDNKNFQRLELPLHDISSAPNGSDYTKIPAETAGFGKDNFTYYTDEDDKQRINWKASRKLLKAKIEILDRDICQKIYSGNIWDTNMCGRVQNYLDGTHQGMCMGDSGSPLVQNGTVIIGVASASSSIECNDNDSPSVYTKVASYLKFIENVKQGITDNMRVIETL